MDATISIDVAHSGDTANIIVTFIIIVSGVVAVALNNIENACVDVINIITVVVINAVSKNTDNDFIIVHETDLVIIIIDGFTSNVINNNEDNASIIVLVIITIDTVNNNPGDAIIIIYKS